MLTAAFLILTAAPASEPLPPPPRPKEAVVVSPGEVNNALDRGVAYLLKNQNADGSWGTPERTKALNIMASPPGSHDAFRSGTTALCVAALIEAGGDSEGVQKAIERGEQWLMENLPKLKRANATELYNVWGHGYGVLALARMHARKPDDAARKAKIETVLKEQYERLEKYASVDGGWGYYDFEVGAKRPAASSTSFVNGMVLCALHEARGIAPPPEKMVKEAIESTVRQRKPDFSYLYGEYLKWQPNAAINLPAGSLGRSQSCNIALRYWGDKKVTDQVLIDWLDRWLSATAGSTWGESVPSLMNPTRQWPATSITSGITTHRFASKHYPRKSDRSIRTIWQKSCCRTRNKMAVGGITRCTTTTSRTAPRMRY